MALKVTNNGERTLGAFAIWAIGVGLVISGESFGWNLGWAISGPIGFFVPLIFVGIMYYCLIQCLIELACVYPSASGPHIYVKNALGHNMSNFVALAVLIEFLFSAPTVASAIGEYLAFLNPMMLEAKVIASIFIGLFCLVNLFDIKIGILFSVILTILAILELFVYTGSVSVSFKFDNIYNTNFDKFDITTFFQTLPYAIWMYFAIEGLSLLTPNIKVKNFKRNLSFGYNSAFWTLTVLAILILMFAGGGVAWTDEKWKIMTSDSHPLPASLGMILSKNSFIVQIFTFVGLFGLIASLQGVILASITQLDLLLKINMPNLTIPRLISPILVFIVCLIAIWGSQTAFLIELSVFGAVIMYFFVTLSLWIVRKKSRALSFEGLSNIEDLSFSHSDFSVLYSNTHSLTAIILSFISVCALVNLHPYIFLVFIIILSLYVIGRLFFSKKSLKVESEQIHNIK